MKTALVYWCSRFYDLINSVGKAVGVLVAFVVWAGLLVERVVSATLSEVIDKLSAIKLEQVKATAMAGQEWIGYVNAVVPLSEMLTLLVAYFAACLTVVSIRWLKSFIPTLSN